MQDTGRVFDFSYGAARFEGEIQLYLAREAVFEAERV